MRLFAKTFLTAAALLAFTHARAQQKGKPGKFDFYLLNIVPAAEFCNIKDVGPYCVTPSQPFVLHGLWAQNNNGTYPVFCADSSGPAHPARNLDLTPDLVLLDHEWKKHGTCTTLSPESFFAQERQAFRAFNIPPTFQHLDSEAEMAPADVLSLFAKINPRLPPGGLILWCSAGKLTSVSACLSKDLKPIACQGLKSCSDKTITLTLPAHR